ncbi:MAG: CD1871A family CXXC motif-containing protein [Suipraeoptans sp.]
MQHLKNLNNRSKLQIVLILLGITCILFGIYRNEISILFMKAIYICLECIGIG